MEFMPEFMHLTFMGKEVWMWCIFYVFVGGLLFLDLGIFHRKDHVIGIKESLMMSAFYICVGLLFSVWVYFHMDHSKAVDYITGFVVEKSLSLDNIFVIAMIFSYFSVPRLYQHRVLFYGIIGVLILRGIMIGVGATLVSQFEWILFLFAGFLIYTGIKMLYVDDEEKDLADNPVLKFLRKNFRITEELRGHKFIVHEQDDKTGKKLWFVTPLLVALVMIEIADVLFAFDSVPAIFALTTDPYIVYTSNVFAILGLRALFFALAAMLERFAYLKYSLSAVLIFIGSKVFIAEWLHLDKFPASVSLGVTVLFLAMGLAYSLYKTSGGDKPEEGGEK